LDDEGEFSFDIELDYWSDQLDYAIENAAEAFCDHLECEDQEWPLKKGGFHVIVKVNGKEYRVRMLAEAFIRYYAMIDQI
jgi:hypothetical protein